MITSNSGRKLRNILMNNPSELDSRSYQLIIDLVLSDGGDGDGTLIVNDDTFDKHVENFSKMDPIVKWFTRADRHDGVIFSCGQEYILIKKASVFEYEEGHRRFINYIVKII